MDGICNAKYHGSTQWKKWMPPSNKFKGWNELTCSWQFKETGLKPRVSRTLQENRWRMNKRMLASNRTAPSWTAESGTHSTCLGLDSSTKLEVGFHYSGADPLAWLSLKGPHHNIILKSADSMKHNQGNSKNFTRKSSPPLRLFFCPGSQGQFPNLVAGSEAQAKQKWSYWDVNVKVRVLSN